MLTLTKQHPNSSELCARVPGHASRCWQASAHLNAYHKGLPSPLMTSTVGGSVPVALPPMKSTHRGAGSWKPAAIEENKGNPDSRL